MVERASVVQEEAGQLAAAAAAASVAVVAAVKGQTEGVSRTRAETAGAAAAATAGIEEGEEPTARPLHTLTHTHMERNNQSQRGCKTVVSRDPRAQDLARRCTLQCDSLTATIHPLYRTSICNLETLEYIQAYPTCLLGRFASKQAV